LIARPARGPEVRIGSGVWREIFAVVRRQRVDPAFRLRPELPVAASAVAEEPDA
jgi:hypothetical protein